MSYKHFPKPVRIILQQSQEFTIASAWDALEFLRGWPAGQAGRAYRIALQHCMDALDGILSPRKAQASFMAAAREAGILATTKAPA
ncbi:uncharacterized protein DUF982 [Rhizobium sp. PP-F2F-G38]|uniref:DUF982 domain-containing protein n=1 Tax=Ferranicluibacter rubi TaxID=2715133 RepID=A0AA43ZGG4_9HYPH|nr:DUF982 domain-containing protein [Ferranicluibacter rubi]PYE26835.1 uncharacterized protein DUF982 [Rhizobium sp. PP-CC-3A-592]PYE37468.1 uncharacterized protein DUF982 [Rhizobium sp. PP-WC-1G-195]PYE45051.1 uncharacterized protein DUF982 [Rhizobium sp. PP-F2F-G20b]PYF00920.1 uncharacterized protein DUF982 [Rhizobium sp. PP-F2F-G38]TCL93782.1 uncharacterized protein DUF982 [Rhizobium sp. PP-WC-2G-219]TCP90396.1 uncharacterized protein DUF982 [Rhizobium sp. PP-CC-2G-626]TCQ27758.1 uncharac